jgi:peptide/nickel transport system substrate-binding protein
VVADGRRRVNRRKVVIGGLVGAGLATGGVAWTLTGRGSGTTAIGTTVPTPVAPTSEPAATSTPAGPIGGVARVVAPASFNFDTFDGQRTGEVSVAEVLGRTHSRLVTWTGFPDATVAGDLATAWEQPDANTWTFHLDPAARWQERAPLNGRALTANDVLKHFERTAALVAAGGLPQAQRGTDFGTIRRVTAPDSTTVVVETELPDPFLLDTLAGRFALIQAPEAVAAFADSWNEQRPEQVVGSGPFTFTGLTAGVLRFASWPGGHRQAFVTGIEVSEPGRDVDAFVTRNVDEFLARDRRDTGAIRGKKDAGIGELDRFEDSPVISSFSTGGAPWDNPGLRIAISSALNRTALATNLFGGRAAPSGPVSPATPGYALTESALAAFGGYRLDAASDAVDARARWAAAGGPALGRVTVEFPSIFDPLYSASTVVTGMLNQVLGDQFRPAIDTYTSIAEKVAGGKYGNGRAAFWFGWGPPLRSPDPSREFVQAFDLRANGAGAAASQDPALTALFDRLPTEMDAARRASLVKECNQALLNGGSAVIPWLLQRSELFRWNYLQRARPTPFWIQHLDAAVTVDAGRRGAP